MTSASQKPPIRILYIAGYGRCGSTLLERMLGQVEGIFTVGEVNKIWDRGFRQDQLCGCGEKFSQCDFWQEVIEKNYHNYDEKKVDAILKLRNSINKYALIVPFITQIKAIQEIKSIKEYIQELDHLFSAIHEAASSDLIIDSTKNPLYMHLLRAIPGIELYVLHMVRDSRAVTYSWMKDIYRSDSVREDEKMLSYKPTQSALQWMYSRNFPITMSQFLVKRYMRVRYEDLVREPKRTLQEILNFTAMSEKKLDFLNEPNVNFYQKTHTVWGNPSRLVYGETQLRLDDAWRSKMPKIMKTWITFLTWPLLLAFGYFGRKNK